MAVKEKKGLLAELATSTCGGLAMTLLLYCQSGSDTIFFWVTCLQRSFFSGCPKFQVYVFAFPFPGKK